MVVQTVELIYDVMKEKITNTVPPNHYSNLLQFVVDENLAEKYNTRKISDRLLGKRSPLSKATTGSNKLIKQEDPEIDVLEVENTEQDNEIDELMVQEENRTSIKQEDLEGTKEDKKQIDFIKQLIQRIDHTLDENEANKKST